jgi:hypothetical protein
MMRDETLAVADITEIFRLLPHRYPFLLVDRVIDMRGDEHGIGVKNLTMNEAQSVRSLGHGRERLFARRSAGRRQGNKGGHRRHYLGYGFRASARDDDGERISSLRAFGGTRHGHQRPEGVRRNASRASEEFGQRVALLRQRSRGPTSIGDVDALRRVADPGI